MVRIFQSSYRLLAVKLGQQQTISYLLLYTVLTIVSGSLCQCLTTPGEFLQIYTTHKQNSLHQGQDIIRLILKSSLCHCFQDSNYQKRITIIQRLLNGDEYNENSRQQYQGKSNSVMHSREGSVHSLNSSSSKQRYTFPKSPRFDKIVSESTDSFYNLPSIKSRRSTSFGFGQKDIGMQKKKVCPSPEAYRIKSQFDNQGKRKGFSFGEGRQDMQLTGPLSQSITKKFIPSPNLYYPKPSQQAFKITLKSRLKDRSLQQLQKNPGPGTYNLQQMGHKNYYITSGNRNKINFKINSSARPETMVETKYNNTKLGPGSYQLTADDISPDGRYKTSKNKNSKAPKFSKSSRPEPTIKHMITTPGPTKYEKYSEFEK